MNKEYPIIRTCSKCGNEEQINITKREAAFDLVDVSKILSKRCLKCKSKIFTTYSEQPDMDEELFQEWAINELLHISPQDEDLLLADEKYLSIIIQLIDAKTTIKSKRNILFEALCVIVYDITQNNGDRTLKQKVINELNQRIDMLKLADNWIMSYIKDIVYPQLNID